MDFTIRDTSETTERELSRTLGYRLLGWSIVTLWAIAVVIFFRVFEQYPPAIDKWLQWVAPLLIIRSVGSAIVHKQLLAGVNAPSHSAMTQMSQLFGLSDGVLLLSLAYVLLASGVVPELALLFAITISLATLAFVYMYTPWVTLAIIGLLAIAGLAFASFRKLDLPMELVLSCIGVLAVTCYGVNRFKSLYLCHLRDKLHFQQEIHQAAESNFIFNEHWQNMHVAAIDWDRDCVIKSWNPAAERLFSIAEEQARGRSLELLFDMETAAEIRSQWIHATEDENFPPVLRNPRQLSGRSPTYWYDTPLFHDGELIGVASYIIDPREQSRAEQRPAAKPVRDIASYRDPRPNPLENRKPLGSRL